MYYGAYLSTEAEVVDLYLRSENMEVSEFEELLDVALRGERPSHPRLSAYPPLPLDELSE